MICYYLGIFLVFLRLTEYSIYAILYHSPKNRPIQAIGLFLRQGAWIMRVFYTILLSVATVMMSVGIFTSGSVEISAGMLMGTIAGCIINFLFILTSFPMHARGRVYKFVAGSVSLLTALLIHSIIAGLFCAGSHLVIFLLIKVLTSKNTASTQCSS